MEKTDIVADLIARAFGLTEPDDISRLQGYLDLYLSVRDADVLCNHEGYHFPMQIQNALNIQENKGRPLVEEVPGGQQAPVTNSPRPFIGKAAVEKTEILNRLRNFRKENGLGCYANIIATSKGTITEAEIRDMYDAAKVPMPKWRELATVLDIIEGVPAL